MLGIQTGIKKKGEHMAFRRGLKYSVHYPDRVAGSYFSFSQPKPMYVMYVSSRTRTLKLCNFDLRGAQDAIGISEKGCGVELSLCTGRLSFIRDVIQVFSWCTQLV